MDASFCLMVMMMMKIFVDVCCPSCSKTLHLAQPLTSCSSMCQVFVFNPPIRK